MKATYGELKVPYNSNAPWVGDEEYSIQSREIFKDPITDDGTKKSLKGLLSVYGSEGKYEVIDECTWKEEEFSRLQTVFEDGKLIREQTLEDIRQRIRNR